MSALPFSLLGLLLLLLASPIRAQDTAPPPPGDSDESAAATPKPRPSSPRPIRIEMRMRDGLSFDPPRFSAPPGSQVIVSLENQDSTHQAHNFSVLQPGKRLDFVNKALALGDQGPALGYIPPDPALIVHSALLDPEGQATIRFRLPEKPSIYPYVCTFPGHGMVMYGAIYSGIPMPPLARDPNIPPQAIQHAIPGQGRRPFVQRIFMPDSGPASIAIALPGGQNACWDATQCRLRYVWAGPFLDAAANWAGNGKALPLLPSPPWWVAPDREASLAIAGTENATPRFLGYRLVNGLPEFHYQLAGNDLFETILPYPAPGQPAAAFPTPTGFSIHYRIPDPTGDVTHPPFHWQLKQKTPITAPQPIQPAHTPVDWAVTYLPPSPRSPPARPAP